ncbi:MAG TPA: hypothetical protein VFO41_05760 [Alphaproteobacteria bacterium]|nr:hypothetical protein [Alphaproteobacteria bacterium]
MLPMPKLQRVADAELLRARLKARGLAVRAAVYAAAVLLTFTGLGFLLFGAFLALAREFGPVTAALIIGLAALALALVTALLARPLAGRRLETAADLAALQARADLEAELGQARALIGAVAPGARGWLRRNRLGVLASAVIAGILAAQASGKKPD